VETEAGCCCCRAATWCWRRRCWAHPAHPGAGGRRRRAAAVVDPERFFDGRRDQVPSPSRLAVSPTRPRCSDSYTLPVEAVWGCLKPWTKCGVSDSVSLCAARGGSMGGMRLCPVGSLALKGAPRRISASMQARVCARCVRVSKILAALGFNANTFTHSLI